MLAKWKLKIVEIVVLLEVVIIVVIVMVIVLKWTLLGTNLIHDFTAVTFSVKLAFFREKRQFLWNPWFFVNFSAFSLIYDN